jgi:acyl-CoA hydrolase/RimJ/RimL family protein N-acetyltransferase
MNEKVAEAYGKKLTSAEKAIKTISQGKRVFVGSFCSEPQHLVSTLLKNTEQFFDIELIRFLNLEGSLMGLTADETRGRSYHVRSIYQGSGMIAGLTAAKRFLTPMNFFTVPALFARRHIPLHYALIQVSPPDDFGWMNLGTSVDITLAAAQTADVVIAQVNARVPRIPGYGMLHLDEVDLLVEKDEELLTTFPLPEIPGWEQIARFVSNLVEDGATVHLSPGLPEELVLAALGHKSGLGVHCQFLTDSIAALCQRGVVTNRKKGFNDGKMVASGAIGSEALYRFLDRNPAVELRPSDYVSNPRIISNHRRMTALHLATQIDLTGQVAADGIPQNHFSDVAGMVDFTRGANLAPEGRTILVVPAATPDGSASNIIPEISAGAIVVPASDVTYVVSEYGVVNLFGKNVQERAMAMISLAHPTFRDGLFNRAREMGLIGRERKIDESILGVYPAWLEETCEIDGQRITFRPAKATDSRAIQEHFYGMDKEDVSRRFFGLRLHFYWDEMKDMFMMDYRNRFSVIAYLGEEGLGKVIGMGMYGAEPGKEMAEVAYSLDSQWRGRGIAVRLQEKIVEAARHNGFAGLNAMTFSDNRTMIKLFKKLPYRVSTRYEEGDLLLEARFCEPREEGEPEAGQRPSGGAA